MRLDAAGLGSDPVGARLRAAEPVAAAAVARQRPVTRKAFGFLPTKRGAKALTRIHRIIAGSPSSIRHMGAVERRSFLYGHRPRMQRAYALLESVDCWTARDLLAANAVAPARRPPMLKFDVAHGDE
jgi:hypothetical protein